MFGCQDISQQSLREGDQIFWPIVPVFGTIPPSGRSWNLTHQWVPLGRHQFWKDNEICNWRQQNNEVVLTFCFCSFYIFSKDAFYCWLSDFVSFYLSFKECLKVLFTFLFGCTGYFAFVKGDKDLGKWYLIGDCLIHITGCLRHFLLFSHFVISISFMSPVRF